MRFLILGNSKGSFSFSAPHGARGDGCASGGEPEEIRVAFFEKKAPQKSKTGSYLLTDTLFTLPRLTLRREQAPALQGYRYANNHRLPGASGVIWLCVARPLNVR